MPNQTTFLPIRTWLLVLVLLATLPAMGIITYNGYQNRQHALDDSREQAVRLAASLRTIQEGIADQARMMLTTLARLSVVEHFDEQACDALFNRLLQSHKELTNILIADATGKVVASGLPPFKGVNVSDRKYFRDALSSGGFSVGDFNIGRTSKLPILVFALPLFNAEGRPDRMVAISFSLQNYEKFLSCYELPQGARVTFFDHAGVRMLTYPPSPSFLLGEKLYEYVLTNVFGARDDAGQFEEKRTDGTDGLFAYARLRLEPGAHVYMGLVIVFSTWESLSAANAQLLQSLLVAVACLIAASAVALLLGEKTLLRGLNALMDASYKLGQGYLAARASEDEGALEVRRLGRAFNAMAGSLQAGRDQLEQNAQELKRMRNLLNNVLESMPSAIIGLDRNRTVTLWNRAAEQLLGCDAACATGKHIGDLLSWLEPELDSNDCFGADAHPLQLHKRPLHLGEESKLVDVLAYPLVANGVEGLVVRIDDVTGRVNMEEMLLQSEKMATVGSLAGGMAHEINNPLAGILQSVQMIRRRLGPDLPANRKAAEALGCDMQVMLRYLEQREVLSFLDAVQVSGERAARIVRNMLGFIRRSASGRVATDMASLLDDTLEIARADYDLKKKYDFRQIEIVRDYAEGVPPLPCSATEMEQVFYNLIANAAQAMSLKKGSGYRPKLTLRVRQEEGGIVVELEDNGPGMTEEVRRRAFEPLFTTKQVGEGTGLGLPLAYFIVVNTYGGEIQLDSAPKEGTRFTLRFPLPGEGGNA